MRLRQLRRFTAPLVALILVGGPNGSDETSRVRIHLRGAETMLAKRDLSLLTPEQRSNRRIVGALLNEYRRAGQFPRNEDFPNRRMPYFRDRRGTLCAMAFLLERTGYGHIVEHVARTRNNAYVRELADEPGLAQWLERFGMTLAEAARVQPGYQGPDPEIVQGKISTGYATASAIGIGLGATGTVLNLTAPPSGRRGAWLAMGAGAATTLLGVSTLDEGGDTRKMAVANIVIGGIATLVGIRGLGALEETVAQGRERDRSFSIAVSMGPNGAPGMMGRLSF